jgi:hypothetical protein
LVAVHFEQIDCRFSDIGQRNDNGSINGPIKMISPFVLLWVEKRNLSPVGQFPTSAIRFETIARWTSEAKVAEARLPIPRNRNDVFNLERNHGQ